MKKISGFTFIEVMVGVAIIGTMAAVAIPNYNRMVNKTRQNEAKTNLRLLSRAMKGFWSEHVYFTTRFETIGFNPEGQLNYVYGFANDVVPNATVVPVGTGACFATGPAQPAAATCNYNIRWQNTIRATSSAFVGGAASRWNWVGVAAGRLAGADDVWTIDSDDNLINTVPNL